MMEFEFDADIDLSEECGNEIEEQILEEVRKRVDPESDISGDNVVSWSCRHIVKVKTR